MLEFIVGHFNYWVVIVLMMTGLYVVISTGNLVKKLVGIGIFQTSVFQLYISLGKVVGGSPPILEYLPKEYAKEASNYVETATKTAVATEENAIQPISDIGGTIDVASDPLMGVIYSNPLPHVLILTAIVVGVATLAVGLALVVRIREEYGSIEEIQINEAEYKQEAGGS